MNSLTFLRQSLVVPRTLGLPYLSKKLSSNVHHFKNQRYFSDMTLATSSTSTPAHPNNSFSHRLNGWGPEHFKTVPFVEENLREVIEEVPDVKYYYIGDEDPQPYPYREIPIDQEISLEEDRPKELLRPNRELQLSKLENGLKIVSLDRGGYVSNLGLFVYAGSRFEDPESFGCSQFIESMAFQATAHLSWLRTIKTIESLGINAGCSAGREHMLYHAELERKYVPVMIPLLTGNVVFPRFLSWDVERKSKEFEEDRRDKFDNNVDVQITELLHTTAWHNNTLGYRLNAHARHQTNYNPQAMRNFMLKHFSPDRMILVGINVNHEELCKWTMRAFVDYEAIPHQERDEPQAMYTGGEARIDVNSPVCHVAIAFEAPGGWNSEDLVPLTVLQTILGGGGSFSTGGPGKGMYTRLYLQVLSNHWVESCVAFNTQYSDSGLFGLYITAPDGFGPAMVQLLVEQFKKLHHVTEEEMNRAKNALKSSVWMNLESRAVVLEDLGRQLLMSGKILSGNELCEKIDQVKETDIQRAVQKMLKTNPTVVSYGNISTIPKYQEIVASLKQ